MMDQITKIKSNQIQPVYFAFGTESFFQEQLKKSTDKNSIRWR